MMQLLEATIYIKNVLFAAVNNIGIFNFELLQIKNCNWMAKNYLHGLAKYNWLVGITDLIYNSISTNAYYSCKNISKSIGL